MTGSLDTLRSAHDIFNTDEKMHVAFISREGGVFLRRIYLITVPVEQKEQVDRCLGRDERTLSCAAIDRPARPCSAVNKAGKAQGCLLASFAFERVSGQNRP